MGVRPLFVQSVSQNFAETGLLDHPPVSARTRTLRCTALVAILREDAVPVADQEATRMIAGSDSAEPQENPLGCWMGSDAWRRIFRIRSR